MSTSVKTAPPRTIDRQRRQRIIDATLQLIAEEGVRSLSHRRVARAAGVPPSAPYYYFKTIDDLLEQAYTEAMDRAEQSIEQITEALDRGEELAAVLAKWLDGRMHQRNVGALSNELLVIVGNSTRLQELGNQWDLNWQRVLSRHVDEATASMLVAVLGGLSQRYVYSNPPMTIEDLTVVLRRAIDGPGSGS